MRALVTGAAGFIGTALVSALRARGWTVQATAREARSGCDALDVTDAAAVTRALAHCDVVFNLAAHRGRPMGELDEATRVNTLGPANLLAAAARRPDAPPRIVLVGSAEEYGRSPILPLHEQSATLPLSAYGASKLAATQLALAAASVVPVVVVRPSVVYGPGQPLPQLVASVVRAALEGSECTLHGGTQTRDLVYVDDVVEALILAAEQADGAARGTVINVGSGEERTVREVAENIVALAGAGTLTIGPASTRPGDVMRLRYDVTRARELLGWMPRTPLEEGLRRTLEIERRAR
jgi:nucleoside-diphosphate-sugar epimerase